MRSPSGPDSARFSFDLGDMGPSRASSEPEVRRIERPRFASIDKPRFAASVGRARPELDSAPDAGESHGELPEDDPPLDLPVFSATDRAASPKRATVDLLGTIRNALRARVPPRAAANGLDPATPSLASSGRRSALEEQEALPAGNSWRTLERSPSGRLKSRALGPFAAAAALGLTYLVSTSSLVAFGPRLARSGPRVPDLGSLGVKKKVAEAPEHGVLASPPSSPKTEPLKEKEPFLESVPLPEGMSYPGKGMIEIVTSERELIYVDSIFLGRGPLRRVPVLPGEHAVKIRSGGMERGAQARVRAAETTRVHFEDDPHLVSAEGSREKTEELD